jgi:hypothetical protein
MYTRCHYCYGTWPHTRITIPGYRDILGHIKSFPAGRGVGNRDPVR